MKKIISITLVGVLTILSLVGCSNTTQSATKTVYTSINPVYFFAKEIGQDKLDIKCLASSSDAHTFEPSAQDMAKMSESDLILYNGLGLDSFVEKMQDSVDVKFINISSNITPINYDHDGHEDHDHSEYDPHVWLSPKNAKLQLETIKNAFIELDPNNKEFYENNYQNAIQKCDLLDEKYKSLSGKVFVVEHNAYSYLAKDYNFTVKAMDTQSNGDLSPASMKEIVDYCKKNNIRTIYYEEGTSDKNAKAIANEINGQIEVLNSFDAAKNDKTNYFEVMEQNFNALNK